VSVVRCVAPRTWVLGGAVLCSPPHYPSTLDSHVNQRE